MTNTNIDINDKIGETLYDVAIVGGGLAGLSLSIQAAKAGYKTILMEKEQYPFHRVCGEYISLESFNFIESLGLPISQMNLPLIKKLEVSAPGGNVIHHNLPLGGIGISRFTIDNELAKIAKREGVVLLENNKVNAVSYEENMFVITHAEGSIRSKVAIGAFGKRSNLDIKWKRHFVLQRSNKLNNYIGVKYHIITDQPADTISLHNFENGYCGISRIEDDKYCLCYLTTADNLRKNGNSFKSLERNVLGKNPRLKEIFSRTRFLFEDPVVISHISFEKKSLVENHILMCGDAAGMITSICGNGMSMAMHAGKIAFDYIHRFLQNEISRNEMELGYEKAWNKAFAKRLKAGRFVQAFFGRHWKADLFIKIIKPFPKFISYLIRQTHGKPF